MLFRLPEIETVFMIEIISLQEPTLPRFIIRQITEIPGPKLYLTIRISIQL